MSVKNLPPEWAQYLHDHLAQGGLPEEAVAFMVQQGFSQEEAAGTVYEFASGPLVLNEEIGLVLYHNFFFSWECDMISEASIEMVPAQSYSPATDVDDGSSHVSCYMGNVDIDYADWVPGLEKRVTDLFNVPQEHGEVFTRIEYAEGGEFFVHTDYFDLDDPRQAKYLEAQGNRVATAIIYLNDVEEGGETWFPHVNIAVRPRKGSLLVFHYPNCEPTTDHAGLPVIKGHKKIVTKWIRERPRSDV